MCVGDFISPLILCEKGGWVDDLLDVDSSSQRAKGLGSSFFSDGNVVIAGEKFSYVVGKAGVDAASSDARGVGDSFCIFREGKEHLRHEGKICVPDLIASRDETVRFGH